MYVSRQKVVVVTSPNCDNVRHMCKHIRSQHNHTGKLLSQDKVLHFTRPLKTRYIQYWYYILATKHIKQCLCDAWMSPVNVKKKRNSLLVKVSYFICHDIQKTHIWIKCLWCHKGSRNLTDTSPAYILHFPPCYFLPLNTQQVQQSFVSHVWKLK